MYGTVRKMVKTTVYLPTELKVRLERLAERRGQSEADVIRTALEEFAARDRPRPRFPLPDTHDEAKPIPPNRVDETMGELVEAELARDLGHE